MDNTELLAALTLIEREKNIRRETILEAIQTSLLQACEKHFGTAENVTVLIDPDTCEYHVIAKKHVVDAEDVVVPIEDIALEEAQRIDGSLKIDDYVNIEIHSREFSRIAASKAKNMILQKIREEERKVIFEEYITREHEVVTGIVQRFIGRNVAVDIGRTDAILNENEQIRGEKYHQQDRIKVYVLEVKDTLKGPRIRVSRTHPELVRKLFEEEVAEIREGIVEIKGIAREAGNRTKISVYSNDENVDPVGTCVGMNASRVNAVSAELNNEKIDVTEWSDNPAMMIENALSPAKVIAVIADADEKSAKVVVPDYQLSLAIGKEGQNARLAARLTGFKIDIKSESQAMEDEDFMQYDDEEYYDDEYDEYEEDEYEEYEDEYENSDEEYYEEDEIEYEDE